MVSLFFAVTQFPQKNLLCRLCFHLLVVRKLVSCSSPRECRQWRTASNRGWSWKASTRSIRPCTLSSLWLRWASGPSPPGFLFKIIFMYSQNALDAEWVHWGVSSSDMSCQVCGYRLRLHFDGYSDCHDFWVNANSPDIHAAGWCESTGHKLHTPKGQRSYLFLH